jgi:hypothetical protein
MTEQEARQKVCPVRWIRVPSTNRAKCIASDCMMWQESAWLNPYDGKKYARKDGDDWLPCGYCGLAK